VRVTLALTIGLKALAIARRWECAGSPSLPAASSALVDLGGHLLHVNCVGNGAPTIIVENGFEEFSFDSLTVQAKLGSSTRVCLYDRAGSPRCQPVVRSSLSLMDGT